LGLQIAKMEDFKLKSLQVEILYNSK